ncbi:MAG: porin family protein [Verrucomicrobiales bacterium]|nr:porin family protein [Verrucomicrobiales bacterium]
MKTRTILTTIAAGFMLSGVAFGGTPVNYQSSAPAPSASFFGPETTISAFGAYVKPDQDALSKTWGAGIGAEHFFSDYFGLGGSAMWVDTDEAGLWHNYTVDAIIRVPINRIAPYALAGAGLIYGDGEFNFIGRLGAGLDFRITRSLGLFGDWIYHFPEGSTGLSGENYSVARVGLKIAF